MAQNSPQHKIAHRCVGPPDERSVLSDSVNESRELFTSRAVYN